MRTKCLILTVLIAGAMLATAGAAEGDSALTSQVLKLLKAYANGGAQAKAKAIQDLSKLGPDVVAEISNAILHKDMAISDAAEEAYAKIALVGTDARADAHRQAQEAFARGDYAAMADQYARLAAASKGQFADCLWLGHAHQLGGRWRQAVEAYGRAARGIDAEIKQRESRGNSAEDLAAKQLALTHLIARIQRELLADPKAACETLKSVGGDRSICTASMREVTARLLEVETGTAEDIDTLENWPSYTRTMRELALAQEAAGRYRQAIDTRCRLYAIGRLRGGWGALKQMPELGRLIRKMPEGKDVGEIPIITVLTPEKPTIKVMLDDPSHAARAYFKLGSSKATSARCRWEFALAPAPGKEFASVEVALDTEQVKGGWDQLTCWTMNEGATKPIKLGRMKWPNGKPPGRGVLRQVFPVHAGAGMVYFRAGRSAKMYRAHSVEVTAKFRPRGETPAVRAKAGMLDEVLPKGGTLRLDGKVIKPGVTRSITHGRHSMSYEVPGRADRFSCELDAVAGVSYGLFVNLDSPFKSSPTPLRGVGSGRRADKSLVRLPDGRWLAVWGTDEEKIMLATSKDLVSWDQPRPLPSNDIFQGVSPSVLVDAKGAIHVAFFSNRLSVFASQRKVSGRRLWLTRSTDSVKWTRPRPVAGPFDDDSAPGDTQMIRGPKGKYWLFWRNQAGCAETVAGIREMKPLALKTAHGSKAINPSVAIDADGIFHMVFDGAGEALCYARSKDGWKWETPVVLMAKASNGRLLLNEGRFALLYKSKSRAHLRRGDLTKPTELSEPIQIGSRRVGVEGSQPTITPDGEVLLLAGWGAPWLLRAKLGDLVGAAAKK